MYATRENALEECMGRSVRCYTRKTDSDCPRTSQYFLFSEDQFDIEYWHRPLFEHFYGFGFYMTKIFGIMSI